jgi:hypothetical protein
VAEAVLAGEKIKKLSRGNITALAAAALAKLARLAKDLFVRKRPGDARYRESEQK